MAGDLKSVPTDMKPGLESWSVMKHISYFPTVDDHRVTFHHHTCALVVLKPEQKLDSLTRTATALLRHMTHVTLTSVRVKFDLSDLTARF